MPDQPKFFTIVFEGDIGAFKANPLKTETPFGVPYTIGRGNALDEMDDLREEAERWRKAYEEARELGALAIASANPSPTGRPA